jgi:hypothetical protein
MEIIFLLAFSLIFSNDMFHVVLEACLPFLIFFDLWLLKFWGFHHPLFEPALQLSFDINMFFLGLAPSISPYNMGNITCAHWLGIHLSSESFVASLRNNYSFRPKFIPYIWICPVQFRTQDKHNYYLHILHFKPLRILWGISYRGLKRQVSHRNATTHILHCSFLTFKISPLVDILISLSVEKVRYDGLDRHDQYLHKVFLASRLVFLGSCLEKGLWKDFCRLLTDFCGPGSFFPFLFAPCFPCFRPSFFRGVFFPLPLPASCFFTVFFTPALHPPLLFAPSTGSWFLFLPIHWHFAIISPFAKISWFTKTKYNSAFGIVVSKPLNLLNIMIYQSSISPSNSMAKSTLSNFVRHIDATSFTAEAVLITGFANDPDILAKIWGIAISGNFPISGQTKLDVEKRLREDEKGDPLFSTANSQGFILHLASEVKGVISREHADRLQGLDIGSSTDLVNIYHEEKMDITKTRPNGTTYKGVHTITFQPYRSEFIGEDLNFAAKMFSFQSDDLRCKPSIVAHFLHWLAVGLTHLDELDVRFHGRYADLEELHVAMLPLVQTIWIVDKASQSWVMGIQVAEGMQKTDMCKSSLNLLLTGNALGGPGRLNLAGFFCYSVSGAHRRIDLTLARAYANLRQYTVTLMNDHNPGDSLSPGYLPSIIIRMLICSGVPPGDIVRCVLCNIQGYDHLPAVQITCKELGPALRLVGNFRSLAAWTVISNLGGALTAIVPPVGLLRSANGAGKQHSAPYNTITVQARPRIVALNDFLFSLVSTSELPSMREFLSDFLSSQVEKGTTPLPDSSTPPSSIGKATKSIFQKKSTTPLPRGRPTNVTPAGTRGSYAAAVEETEHVTDPSGDDMTGGSGRGSYGRGMPIDDNGFPPSYGDFGPWNTPVPPPNPAREPSPSAPSNTSYPSDTIAPSQFQTLTDQGFQILRCMSILDMARTIATVDKMGVDLREQQREAVQNNTSTPQAKRVRSQSPSGMGLALGSLDIHPQHTDDPSLMSDGSMVVDSTSSPDSSGTQV